MKRIISLLLCLVMITSCMYCFTGCSIDEEETIEEILMEKYEEVYPVLLDAEDADDMTTFLLRWAKTENIKASYDQYGNVIMSKIATDGYQDVPSTIYQVTIDLDNPEHTATSMSVASYIIENVENHGFIRFIFTAGEKGMRRIARAYLTADNFISLDGIEPGKFIVGSAGSYEYDMRTKITWDKPLYTSAYHISISGLSGASFTDQDKHPNPITIVGNLIANAKSSSILIEIAELTGGESYDTYPTGVECTILFNQNDEAKMIKRMDKSISSFYDKYSESEPDAVYTYEQVELPEKVVSFDSTATIVSFLYTCIDGNYLKSDSGELIAKTNIGYIDASDNRFEVKLCAKSKSQAVLDEITETIDTICGLCDFDYSTTKRDSVWESAVTENTETNENSEAYSIVTNPLIDRLTLAQNELAGTSPALRRSMDYISCSTANMRVPYMNCVCIGLDESNRQFIVELILKYMSDLNRELVSQEEVDLTTSMQDLIYVNLGMPKAEDNDEGEGTAAETE